MLKSFLITSLVSAASIVTTLPAHALSTYSFSFSGTFGGRSGSGSGIFTTADLPVGATAATSVLIQNISGSITDSTVAGGLPQTITALLAPGTFFGNDNLLFPLAADPNKFSFGGVSFTAGGLSYNLFRLNTTSYQFLRSGPNLANTNTINLALVAPVLFEFSPALGIGVLGGLFAAKKLSRRFSKK